jgi:hypothetical protein
MVNKIALENGWKIKRQYLAKDRLLSDQASAVMSDDTGWIPADHPGQVQEILLENGMIDPSILENGITDEYKWIAESDWSYSCCFSVPERAGAWFLN